MAKRKACKTCRLFVEGTQCPSCKGNKFTDNWKGRIYISDAERSMIAQEVGIKVNGEYAIKAQ